MNIEKIKQDVANFEASYKWYQHPDAVNFKNHVKALLPVVEAAMAYIEAYDDSDGYTRSQFMNKLMESIIPLVQASSEQTGGIS